MTEGERRRSPHEPAAFDHYTVVLLKRPPNATTFDEEELARIQDAHLAHLAAMEERGFIVVNGPFDVGPDDVLRGMTIYRTEPRQTRTLAEADPAVRAGRLEVEVVPWLTGAGRLRTSPDPDR